MMNYQQTVEYLFNATPVSTYGGHANLSTSALSAETWDTVCSAVYRQPMLVRNEVGTYGVGLQMAVNPKYILVPRALQRPAMAICTGASSPEIRRKSASHP